VLEQPREQLTLEQENQLVDWDWLVLHIFSLILTALIILNIKNIIPKLTDTMNSIKNASAVRS
jgi:hypothetical protein